MTYNKTNHEHLTDEEFVAYHASIGSTPPTYELKTYATAAVAIKTVVLAHEHDYAAAKAQCKAAVAQLLGPRP